MTKTVTYSLPQWEATDALKRGDFNDALESIDAALAAKAEKSAVTAVETALANYKTSNDAAVNSKANTAEVAALSAALANKADTSAITALQTQMGSKGNCKIFHGSYVGTGQKGYKYPNTLTFDFQPLVVVITGGDGASTFLSGMATQSTSTKFTWSGNTVSWYNEYGSSAQFNDADVTYHYAAIGV